MPIPPQLPYILSTSDLYLTPVYIITSFFDCKKTKEEVLFRFTFAKFYFSCILFHVIGSIFFALDYQYYYGYGDMFGYFTGAHETWEAFIKNPK